MWDWGLLRKARDKDCRERGFITASLWTFSQVWYHSRSFALCSFDSGCCEAAGRAAGGSRAALSIPWANWVFTQVSL